MSKKLFAVTVLALLVGCGGDSGNGGSPTAPPLPAPTLSVDGVWSGFWNTSGVPFPMTISVSQSPGSRSVAGSISFLGESIPIAGETNYVSSGRGTFNFEDTLGEPGCSFIGNLEIAGGSAFGNFTFDATCVAGPVRTGPLSLTRIGASTAGSSAIGSPDLRAIERAMP